MLVVGEIMGRAKGTKGKRCLWVMPSDGGNPILMA